MDSYPYGLREYADNWFGYLQILRITLGHSLGNSMRYLGQTARHGKPQFYKMDPAFLRLRRNPPSNLRGLPPALRVGTIPKCDASPYDPLEKIRSKWTISPKIAGARRYEDPLRFATHCNECRGNEAGLAPLRFGRLILSI